jgi:hypothetical protein
MYRRCLYLFLAGFVLISCNDHLEIEANNNPQGYADSQLVGLWKVTGLTSNLPFDWDGNGTTETDVYSTWSDCQKNNLYRFDGNKTGVYQLNCNSTHNGVWQIFNVQQLEYTPDGMSTHVERFISMTSNQFKTTRTETVSQGQTFTITKIWSRQ